MKKSLKILLAVCASLVVLCLTVAIAATILVDPNAYKGEIVRLVREKTGRQLAFEGEIELNFFPYVGFSVGPVALGNGPGFSSPEMVRIKRAKVSLDLIPLVSGRVCVGKLVLDGLSVHLDKNAEGVGNWEALAGAQDAAAETASPNGPADSDGQSVTDDDGGLNLEDISVQGVEITDAGLVYMDAQQQSVTSVGNLNLTLGAIHGTDAIPFALDFNLVSEQPKLALHPKLSGDIRLAPAARTVTLDNLTVSALGAQLSGRLRAGMRNGEPQFSGTLRLADTSPRDLLDKLGITLPETSDPSVLERLSAEIQFIGTSDSLQLNSLTAKIDDTTMSVQGAVINFHAPKISLAMQVDGIDLDRYLPPPAESEPASGVVQRAADSKPARPEQEPDLSALRDLTLDARMAVGGLKVRNVKASDIRIAVNVHDGVLCVSALSLSLYGGRFEGRATLDANGQDVSWAGQGSLQGLNTLPLLHDLLGRDVLSGAASVDFNLTGSGLTAESVKKSVCGNAALSVTDGAVVGVDVAKMIRDGLNQATGDDAEDGEPGDFEYSRLSASATLKNGHLVNDDLELDSTLVEASGAGWADLPGNSTDYKAMVTVVGSLDGLEGELLETVQGVPLPLHVQGKLDQPLVGLDTEAVGKLFVTAGVNAGLDILVDGLLGDAPDDSSLDGDEDSESDEYVDRDTSGEGRDSLLDVLF
ncbi:AsmA family protein [uncultured Pseudodesulfovibrio sp.]|uniref:AsmA family protein n=1 Tax=uncultured Pseudodesulfovibrio sp. TaxID=2035858 RepID=UPI0029C6482B|nr:AsmA family protein [uncultured Pseudodesulfovibrio sp.]